MLNIMLSNSLNLIYILFVFRTLMFVNLSVAIAMLIFYYGTVYYDRMLFFLMSTYDLLYMGGNSLIIVY